MRRQRRGASAVGWERWRVGVLPGAALAATVWAAACGGGGGGGTGDDVAEGDVADVQGDSTPEDVAVDAASDVEEDTGPPPCVPGTRRCLDAAVAGYEVCGESLEWERFFCSGEEICFDGICQGRICEPFEVESCTDCRTYVGCNAGGTSRGTNPVPGDRVCEVVDGVAQLVPATCNINAVRCSESAPNVVERCNACGTGWEESVDCVAEDPTRVCDLGQCISQCEFIRKRNSYIGCEYWAVDLDNAFVPAGGGQYIDADGKPFAVVVANPSETLTAEVTVSMVDGPVAQRSIAPGGLEVIKLHFYASASDREGIPLADIQGTEIGSKAFRVESTLPIVAYQFNPLDNEIVYSNDASLLFPTSSLGTDYWVMTRRQTFDSLKGYVTVAAVLEGTTTVTVTLPEYTLENPVVTLAGVNHDTAESIPPMRGGDSRTFTLQQFQVLNIETNRPGADLTGTHITADRSVAVFGGAEAANAPNDDSCVYRPSFDDWVCEATRLTASPTPCVNGDGVPDITLCSDFITCCADHIEHQMLPAFAWGRRFNATRSVPRGDEADSWRVLADQDGTEVSLEGLPDTWPLRGLLPSLSRRNVTLNAGEWIDFQSPVDFEINATRPVMVGQFLAAEQAPYPSSIDAEQAPHEDAHTGDPAFILAVPAEQYRSDYTFLAPDAFEFDYVTVTAPAGVEVLLDEEPISRDSFTSFGDGSYEVARLRVADGVHTIRSAQPFGLMVHGYDQYVSYGYAGGLDLRDLSGGR
ncbi:MAG: IgGFc-binding protein [Myxococcales bacterium]|nr:IgGFc-binding protein [Myxococcales bacterium]